MLHSGCIVPYVLDLNKRCADFNWMDLGVLSRGFQVKFRPNGANLS